MIVLIGNVKAPAFTRKWLQGRDNIGALISPAHMGFTFSGPVACDNDVYGNRDDPAWWKREGEASWLKMLDKLDRLPRLPMFCVLPDVVGDWERTIARAHRYREELTQRNLPAAIALQDGAERDWDEALSVSPAYVFIGGTTEWKWRHAREITEHFHWRDVRVHVGRVSGPLLIRRCLDMGADSCDGTGWFRHPSSEMPKLFRELDQQRMML